jgi:hypothetical protein
MAEEQPIGERFPLLFVRHGEKPDPAWLAAHPGWVKFPATFVPRPSRATTNPTSAVRSPAPDAFRTSSAPSGRSDNAQRTGFLNLPPVVNMSGVGTQTEDDLAAAVRAYRRISGLFPPYPGAKRAAGGAAPVSSVPTADGDEAKATAPKGNESPPPPGGVRDIHAYTGNDPVNLTDPSGLCAGVGCGNANPEYSLSAIRATAGVTTPPSAQVVGASQQSGQLAGVQLAANSFNVATGAAPDNRQDNPNVQNVAHYVDRSNQRYISGQDTLDALANPISTIEQDNGNTLVKGKNGISVVLDPDGNFVTVFETK